MEDPMINIEDAMMRLASQYQEQMQRALEQQILASEPFFEALDARYSVRLSVRFKEGVAKLKSQISKFLANFRGDLRHGR